MGIKKYYTPFFQNTSGIEYILYELIARILYSHFFHFTSLTDEKTIFSIESEHEKYYESLMSSLLNKMSSTREPIRGQIKYMLTNYSYDFKNGKTHHQNSDIITINDKEIAYYSWTKPFINWFVNDYLSKERDKYISFDYSQLDWAEIQQKAYVPVEFNIVIEQYISLPKFKVLIKYLNWLQEYRYIFWNYKNSRNIITHIQKIEMVDSNNQMDTIDFDKNMQSEHISILEQWVYSDHLNVLLDIESELLQRKFLNEEYNWLKSKIELLDLSVVIKEYNLLKPIVNGIKKKGFHYRQLFSTLYLKKQNGLTETYKKYKPDKEKALIPFYWLPKHLKR